MKKDKGKTQRKKEMINEKKGYTQKKKIKQNDVLIFRR